MKALATTAAPYLLIFSLNKNCICGFSLPPTRSTANSHCSGQKYFPHNAFPVRLENWDHCDVEDWLCNIGFGRYSEGFAADFGGIGVDGDRLIYLGTEDQLDHIEYQLSLIGVDDESDQKVLGSTIIELVAASEVTPGLLESLVEMVPIENRDKKIDEQRDKRKKNSDAEGSAPKDFEI